MSLDIKIIKKQDNVHLVELRGPIDSDTYQILEDRLKEIVKEKAKAVVFDMKDVDYISSIGIRVLIDAKKTIEGQGTIFAMMALQPQIRKVFDIMKILPIFTIFDNHIAADKYFGQAIFEGKRL